LPGGTFRRPVARSSPADAGRALRDALAGGAVLRYQILNKDVGSRSTVTLRHQQDNIYAGGDGTRLQDLSLLVQDAEFVYSPAIPLFKAPLTPGRKWSHSGSVTSLRGLRNSFRVDCTFEVVGPASVELPTGRIDAVEIREEREMHGNLYRARRFVDERRGLILREVWSTVRHHSHQVGGRVESDMVLLESPAR
jgi:hypothetical protein